MSENTSAEEKYFFEGPHSRSWEFKFTLKVFFQFIKGFRKFHFLNPCVTFFGSARFKEGHPYYQMAREAGASIAKEGFTVMTGGGPGLMEAANRGAREVHGKSVGCNIVLPIEQEPNPYLDQWVSIDYFFVRKVLLSKYSYAFVVMPGGYGTLDEFFEAITLIQTKKMKQFPVVLLGTVYHKELYSHLKNMQIAGTIDPGDLSLFLFTDDIKEMTAHIVKHATESSKLKRRTEFKPINLLREGGK